MIDGVKNFFKTHGHLTIWFYVLNALSGIALLMSRRYNNQNDYRDGITLLLWVTVAVGIRRAYKLSDVSLGLLYGALGLIFFGKAIFYRATWHDLYCFIALALWVVPPFVEYVHNQTKKQYYDEFASRKQIEVNAIKQDEKEEKSVSKEDEFYLFRMRNAQRMRDIYLAMVFRADSPEFCTTI